MTLDYDNQTLQEYIKSLAKQDIELVSDLPHNDIDALIDIDFEELEKIKNKSDSCLTKEQIYRRQEIIQRISDLIPFALVARDSKNNSWNHPLTELNPPKQKKNDRTLREFTIYKYSQMGHGELHEAVILDNSPRFIAYESEIEQVKVLDNIKQETRILVPPAYEEYPYTPYEFKDKELYEYIKRAKLENIESLYRQALAIVKKYIDQDEYKQILIAADIILSYFQDRFGTTHYIGVVGDNGSGKSTVGSTFDAIGYRCVNSTNPSAANIFRVLGVVEPGQCTLVLDESDMIDESPEIMAILKTGYDYSKKFARINNNTLKQEFFFTYCLKVIIAERSLSQFKARGLNDRILSFTTSVGDPLYDIKEITSPQGNPDREKRLRELLEFRKLMLVYRLIHFKNPIIDIDICIKGRNKELVKPCIQLFYGTTVQHDIENTLQKFIDAKNEKKSTSLEYALVSILCNLIGTEANDSLPVSRVWQEIVRAFGGSHYFDSEGNDSYPDEFHSTEYGTLYKRSVMKIIYDKLGAESKREGQERIRHVSFNIGELLRIEKFYDSEVRIKTTLKMADNKDNKDNRPDNTPIPKEENSVNLVANNENADRKDMSDSTVSYLFFDKSNRKDGINEDTKNAKSPISVGRVVLVGHTVDQSRNAGKIHRIGHSDRFYCEDCSLRDDIHFMRDHDCSGFKQPIKGK